MKIKKGVIELTKGNVCAGLIIRDDKVAVAAPILRRYRGLTVEVAEGKARNEGFSYMILPGAVYGEN